MLLVTSYVPCITQDSGEKAVMRETQYLIHRYYSSLLFQLLLTYTPNAMYRWWGWTQSEDYSFTCKLHYILSDSCRCLSYMITTSLRNDLYLKLNILKLKIKFQLFGHASHISSVQYHYQRYFKYSIPPGS